MATPPALVLDQRFSVAPRARFQQGRSARRRDEGLPVGGRAPSEKPS